MNRVAFFLRHVLRDTRIAMLGLICATAVDSIRPRGPCGTHAAPIAITLFFGSMLLCVAGVAGALSRARTRRVAELTVGVAVNVYSCALSLYLCLPYAPDLRWPFP